MNFRVHAHMYELDRDDGVLALSSLFVCGVLTMIMERCRAHVLRIACVLINGDDEETNAQSIMSSACMRVPFQYHTAWYFESTSLDRYI